MKTVQSSLVLFSIGYVTANKEYGSRFVQALPVESASGTDGETTHNPVEEILKGTDSEGRVYEVKATATRDVECEWLPFEDNRVTPPDVRLGELVEIYRLGNTSQYFWRCMGLRNGLRTLEHVVFAFGASPDRGGSGVDFDKCYTLTYSPYSGHITLMTSKANGEPFKYTFQINTAEGFLGIQDDVGNFIELNSGEKRIRLNNANNSFINIEKQWIDMKADKYIKMTVGGTNFEMTPTTITSNTQTNTLNSTTANINGNSNINIKSPKVVATVGQWDFA